MEEWTIKLDYDRYATIFAETLEEAEGLAVEIYGVDFIEIVEDEE